MAAVLSAVNGTSVIIAIVIRPAGLVRRQPGAHSATSAAPTITSGNGTANTKLAIMSRGDDREEALADHLLRQSP